MPVYAWTSQQGTFSQAQQKLLAKAVTDIHCGATGAPRNVVRTIFNPGRHHRSYAGRPLRPQSE
ncbi:tautomerase family protein [Bradyrhizobium sp. McL0616]|uniref:tautomerase family protein n=1 Tax=Bradyrhizobium sp. McL0616 TaxID=3415674 RepID=UPI003CEF4114